MRRFVVFVILLFSIAIAIGQEQFSLLDTIQIEEVVSYGDLQKYQSGAKIEYISSWQFELSQDGSLEQLLLKTMPIAFKTDAGGLSTIRIRGTGPNHTSIIFGGININSLTLGHSNVSSIPVYLFDNVGVQFGSSSAVNGSGSIGGAIQLGIENKWTNGLHGEARVTRGSFGEKLYGTKLFVGNGKFESVTRFYYYSKKNDFPFTNHSYRDFENQIFEIEDRQHNAGIENYGLLQEINYLFSTNEYFTFNAWLEKNWYLVQQNMQVNLSNPAKREEMRNDNVRIWSAYRNRKNPFKFEIGGGYVFDNSVIDKNTSDTLSTQRIIAEVFAEHDFIKNASYKTGIKAERIYPTVYAYSSTLHFEDRVDFFASYYHRFFQKLTATVNIRQGFVTGFSVPLTPSFGVSYLLLSKNKYVLNVTGNVSKSYRVPTFNDRFWQPGGNKNLNPEKGMNYELGTRLSYRSANSSGNIKLNVFLMNVDNWILWKNGGAFWYADNVQKVKSKGLELMADWQFNLLNILFSSGLNYSFKSAQRVKSNDTTNALFRQLEYVPLHSGNFFTTATIKSFDFTIDGRYTDKQYTDEEIKNVLDAYFLFNFSTACNLKINKENSIKFSAIINNIFDTEYQSSWGYAMPGRYYRMSLTYNFK